MKPSIAITEWSELLANQSDEAIIDFVAAPFHERIYQDQSFDLLDQLNSIQKALVIHHYIMMHVPSGGFIQFIHNLGKTQRIHFIQCCFYLIQNHKRRWIVI